MLPDGTTLVGCCLLEISDLRPNALPAVVGVRVRAAAHRISVEWDGANGETQVGVYVPMRHTDSRLAAALGGRLFPGVHQHTRIDVARTATHLDWHVGDLDGDNGFGLQVRVDTNIPMIDPTPLLCSTCVDPTLGLSPDHHGRLEAARMAPDSRKVRAVHVDELRSTFLDGYESATPATAYLMEDLGVRWSTDSSAIIMDGAEAAA